MRRAPNPPYDKWLKVEGSPVKKVRFRKSGNVDVVIVPRRRNESIRKTMKRMKKKAGFQAADATIRLLKGIRRPKGGLAAVKKYGKGWRNRPNPSSYVVYPGTGSPKSFGFLKSAKKWAKEQANASGISSVIYPQGKGKTHHVSPDKKRSTNLFGFGRKKRKRKDSGAGYMVLDREGLPVHSGRDLPRSEALELAKEARSHGEKGVHLVKTKKAPKAKRKK